VVANASCLLELDVRREFLASLDRSHCDCLVGCVEVRMSCMFVWYGIAGRKSSLEGRRYELGHCFDV
jgi:hypothetical protein